MHISKNNGGHNSKTLSNSSPLKRKTHFLIFLAIFKSHLSPKILIFEKNPFTIAVSVPKSFHLTAYSPTTATTSFMAIFFLKKMRTSATWVEHV